MGDEMPPRWMWHLDEELEVWFEEIDEKRKQKYSTNSSDDESGNLVRNELINRGR